MRLSKARVEPLPEAEWTPEIQEILPRGSGKDRCSTSSRRSRTIRSCSSAGWCSAITFVQVTLPPREREMAILRIGGCALGVRVGPAHRDRPRGVGLTDEEIGRIAMGPEAPGWNRAECDVAARGRTSSTGIRIEDATWELCPSSLRRRSRSCDLVFAVGQYKLVSMALKSLGVELDAGIEGFAR